MGMANPGRDDDITGHITKSEPYRAIGRCTNGESADVKPRNESISYQKPQPEKCMEFSNDYMSLKSGSLRGPEEMELKGRRPGVFNTKARGRGVLSAGQRHGALGRGMSWWLTARARGKLYARENAEMSFWFFTVEFENLIPLFSAARYAGAKCGGGIQEREVVSGLKPAGQGMSEVGGGGSGADQP